MIADVDPSVEHPHKRVADRQGPGKLHPGILHVRPERVADQVARAEVVDDARQATPRPAARLSASAIRVPLVSGNQI